MKPAVLMMFRDESDILGDCLDHWYALGVRDFYLCDNGSTDKSRVIATRFCVGLHHKVTLTQDPATDWPGRRVINDLKNRALADGCDWLFPADADEFLTLLQGQKSVQEWLSEFENRPHGPFLPGWLELPYLNILPDGREYWQEPQRKCFGKFTKGMMISMGNHLVEGVNPAASLPEDLRLVAHYRHYSLRSYPQWRRKMENYMEAFHQMQFQSHPHAIDYHQWKAKGESFLRRRWTELTGLEA
jgi:hypothetical protein